MSTNPIRTLFDAMVERLEATDGDFNDPAVVSLCNAITGVVVPQAIEATKAAFDERRDGPTQGVGFLAGPYSEVEQK
jgi:hypothetical protein